MELVSGPDVGGGFLFQLTRERGEPLAVYTVHAQEGGLDGGDLPSGTPAEVGFQLAAGMCSIGGRRCYHRTYELPLSENARVRFAYNRLRFVIGPMLEQRAGRRPVPYDEGIATALPRIARALGPAGTPWMIGGSSAAAFDGAAVMPHDVDLLTDRAGVDAIAGALEEFVIEPPALTRWADGPPRLAAKAFVGTLTDGLRVEWAEPWPDGAPTPPAEAEWTAATLGRARSVSWHGETIPIAPIEYALAAALRRSDDARVRAILAARAPATLDRGLLDGLLTGDRNARSRALAALGG